MRLGKCPLSFAHRAFFITLLKKNFTVRGLSFINMHISVTYCPLFTFEKFQGWVVVKAVSLKERLVRRTIAFPSFLLYKAISYLQFV
jgi:hypothetical protein